jgi:hypothetical protein
MENNSIVKIDPKEFGIEEHKAEEISAQFKPMLDKMVELEKEYNKILSLPVDDKKTSRLAFELRQKYVKVRTGTAEIHKLQKAFYLAGGRFVDGWKNAQLFASQGIEKQLEDIEKYAENLEKERIAKLEQERKELLAPYSGVIPVGLGLMDNDVFDNYLNGLKVAHQMKIEAERVAEEERKWKEEEDRLEQERIRQENEKLRKEAEEREKVLAQERAKQEAVRIEQEKKLAEQKAIQEAELAKQREESEKKLKAEREAKAKIEAELKAKQEAEAKVAAEAQLKAKKEAEAKAKAERQPDKKKLEVFAGKLLVIDMPDVNSAEAKAVLCNAQEMLVKINNFIQTSIKNL